MILCDVMKLLFDLDKSGIRWKALETGISKIAVVF